MCDKDPLDKDRGAISVVLSADERSRMASVRRVLPVRAKGEVRHANTRTRSTGLGFRTERSNCRDWGPRCLF